MSLEVRVGGHGQPVLGNVQGAGGGGGSFVTLLPPASGSATAAATTTTSTTACAITSSSGSIPSDSTSARVTLSMYGMTPSEATQSHLTTPLNGEPPRCELPRSFPLVIAGGGGGASLYPEHRTGVGKGGSSEAADVSLIPSELAGKTPVHGDGGLACLAGGGGCGGGGGGWFSDGGSNNYANGGERGGGMGGFSRTSQGACGGFGGGGGSMHGGGGGGGFSGGFGGTYNFGGCGGGSYVFDDLPLHVPNQPGEFVECPPSVHALGEPTLRGDVNIGHGLVVITMFERSGVDTESLIPTRPEFSLENYCRHRSIPSAPYTEHF